MRDQLPNLLFILTDEQRLDTLGCYGNTRIETPNLDALARTCCVFESPHCVQPVCTPSRGSIQTGLYPHRHGAVANNIPMSREARCLPELLSPDARARCVTCLDGKWHLGDELWPQHGFDQWVSIEDRYTAWADRSREERTSDYHHFLLDQGFTLGPNASFDREFPARLPERFGRPAFVADQACYFLRRHREQPFILSLGFLEPHMPFHGPRDRQYPPEEVPLPENFDPAPGKDEPLWAQVTAERFRREGEGGFALATEDDWRSTIARYWGLVSLVDAQVGRVLRTLEECGLAESTVVVFTSDHGDMMGSHRLLQKGLMYREATRVPLLVRMPGQTRPGRITGPVSQIDLVPTLLDLLGQQVPDQLPGKSLAPVMRQAVAGGSAAADGRCSDCVIVWNPNLGRDGKRPKREVAEWMAQFTGRSLEECAASAQARMRTLVTPEGYRFTHSSAGEHALYNLNIDPGETRNLIHEPGCRVLVEDCLRRLREWQKRTGDPHGI